MANDDVKTRHEAGKPPANGRANKRDVQEVSLNGDDAIAVAALSGRDAAELGRLSRGPARFWNQMET